MARRSRTGPVNLGGMGLGLKARGPAVRGSRASMPSPRAARGDRVTGATPPMGGGIRRVGNPITVATRTINKPKTGRPSSFSRTPRADGVSRI